MQWQLKTFLGFSLLTVTPPSIAGVAEFASFTDWEAAAGDFQTITFTDFPNFTFITDQYRDLGVVFVDGDDNVFFNQTAFPPDGVGLDGNESITLDFIAPQHNIGVTFPGVVAIWLYNGETLIHSSVFKDFGTPGAFAGLVSDVPFDIAYLFDLSASVNIGDLYFGPPIPAPGALGLMAIGFTSRFGRRRDRRRSAAVTRA